MAESDLQEPSDAIERSSERRLLALIAVLCGVLIAAGLTMPLVTGANSAPPAMTMALDGLSEAHIVEIRDRRGRTVLSGEFRSSVDALGNTEKDAGLTDRRGAAVIGEVELELPASARANRRVELEVDIIGLPANETFTIVIDDRTVGTFGTDDRGSVDMEVQEGELPAARP
jgi:hypothetical protein